MVTKQVNNSYNTVKKERMDIIMDLLLAFFALPVATIILSIVLYKILKCPILVGLTFFAIYLIVTFAAIDSSFLINTIIYTFISFITAFITQAICNNMENDNDSENSCDCGCNNNSENNNNIFNNNCNRYRRY